MLRISPITSIVNTYAKPTAVVGIISVSPFIEMEKEIVKNRVNKPKTVKILK